MQIIKIDGFDAIFDNFDLSCFDKKLRIQKNKNMMYVLCGQSYIHRIVMDAKKGEIVDHINGNGLDNRKENLRIVNHQQNRKNAFHGNKTSKYFGVSIKRGKINKFRAQIKINKKRIHLGIFENETLAAIAYNEAAFNHYGTNATLNEIK